MADVTKDANSDDATQKKTSSSPWDDELDIPEEPEEKKMPQIIGSLDPQDAPQDEKPVPFNIPEEVIEDKVAKKIPAKDVMGTTKPQYYIPENKDASPNSSFKVEPDKNTSPATPSNPKPVPKAPEAISSAPNLSKPQEAPKGLTEKPAAQVEAPKTENSVQSGAKDVVRVAASSPKDISSESKPDSQLLTTPSDESADKSAALLQTSNASPVAQVKPDTTSLSASKTVIKGGSEAGISELLKTKDAAPDTSSPLRLDKPKQKSLGTESEIAPSPEKIEKIAEKRNESNGRVMDIQPPISQAKAAVTDSGIKSPLAVKPEPQISEPVSGTPSAEKVVSAVAPAPERPPAKKSFLSRFNPFSRGSNKKNLSQQLPQSVARPAATPQSPSKPGVTAQPATAKSAPRPGLPKSSGKLAYVFSILLLLVACVYLTEIGVLSIGLEKIYGIIKVEQLWGGLPRGTESALAKAVVAQKNNLSFKFSGKITATIDKSKKSPVTSPLVAVSGPWVALADINVAGSSPARLTQYDYYGTNTEDDSDAVTDDESDTTGDATSSGNSTVGNSGSSTVTNSGSVPSTTPSTSNAASTTTEDTTSSSGYGADQSSTGSYSNDETTVKQLDFEISGSSSDDAIASNINLKPIVGSDKKIETIASHGNLYVKSSDIKFDDKAESGKWLQYQLAGFSAKNTWEDFTNIKFDTGLSVSGTRVGNDKLSDGRAFHYKIYSMELGDSLASLGVPGSAIDSINGDVWIGIRDHLIKKVSLEITPSVASSVTKLNVELNFSEYGADNSITEPTLDNVVKISTPANTSSASGNSSTETATDNASGDGLVDDTTTHSATSTPTPTVNSSARTANDIRRNSDLESLKSALLQYKAKNGRYPISNNYLNIGKSGNVLEKALVTKYISSLPSDPNAASGWWYGYKSDGTTFTLSARFENIYDAEVTNVNGIYLHYIRN